MLPGYTVSIPKCSGKTNQKFMKRFGYLEERTIKAGKNLKDMSLDEMNVIWEEAKEVWLDEKVKVNV